MNGRLIVQVSYNANQYNSASTKNYFHVGSGSVIIPISHGQVVFDFFLEGVMLRKLISLISLRILVILEASFYESVLLQVLFKFNYASLTSH